MGKHPGGVRREQSREPGQSLRQVWRSRGARADGTTSGTVGAPAGW
jgi:hypothetical protein